MKRFPLHRYRVDLSVGRSYRINLDAISENEACMIATDLLVHNRLKAFTPNGGAWIDIEDAAPVRRGRPPKSKQSDWPFPWEWLRAGKKVGLQWFCRRDDRP